MTATALTLRLFIDLHTNLTLELSEFVILSFLLPNQIVEIQDLFVYLSFLLRQTDPLYHEFMEIKHDRIPAASSTNKSTSSRDYLILLPQPAQVGSRISTIVANKIPVPNITPSTIA